MITLIKIRTKYLTNHLCSVYFSYFLIPSLLLISFIFVFYNAFTRGSNEYQDIKTDWTYSDISKSLFSQDFSSLKNISLVSDDEKDKQILKELTNLDIEWANDINKLPNKANNIYKIINKGEKYKIELIQKKESYYFSENDLKTIYFDPFTPNEANYLDESKLNIFIKLQSLFAQFLIKKKGKSFSQKELNIQFGQNSYPPHIKQNSKSFDYKITFFTFGFSLQFTMTSYFFCMRMIDEKEKKLTELLQRQGISNISYFFSWFLTYLFIIFIPIIIYLLFYWIITPLHILLFTLDIILFILSIYSFTYFLYICIKKSKTGSVVIKFINFSTSILGLGFISETIPKSIKIISALIPQINVYHCAFTLDKLQVFKNLSWEKVWLRTGKISFMESIIMYLVEIIFYSLLSLIIMKFRNSGLGFCQFLLSCCKKVSRKIDLNEENNINENKILNFESHFQELSPINQQKKEAKDCLSIVNVTKNFDSLKAVDNFNGDLFGNEIFCLLGHNGAGKTTLISMISGIIDPTKGDIFYKGRSLVTNKDYLFENIGICQQEDIFFDYLTVSEHLEYMCGIKGSRANVQEIKNLIMQIGLTEKANSLCKTLSGGQKRKLCTALALIGNSNIILLDEPTSGMDPISRKALWDFLKNYQRNKIILITTHSLDEAEYLGDRIGIMSDGQFICCGSSSFLKSKYPCGFNVNLLINSEKFTEEKKKNIFEGIKKYEPDVNIRIASKSIFSLNIQSNNEHIPDIFKFIEESKEEYGIEDYTVASTSLEDVFLKINNKSSLEDMKYTNKKIGGDIALPENVIEISDFFTQFISQLKRSFMPVYRNKLVLLLDYLSGLGFIYIFGLIFRESIYGINNSYVDLFDILEENNIYIYEDNWNNGVLKNSYVYNSMAITMKPLSKKPNDIKHLINLAYEESFANIAMGCISINVKEDKWQTYITQLNIGNLFADTMFVVSSFLKKEFEIDAMILNKIEMETKVKISPDGNLDRETLSILIMFSIGSLLGYIIFLGELINEKINERRTNIKHLLYLSGSNSFSYWLAFFVIDYIKLLIFTILFIIPIYLINNSGGIYLLLNILVANVSSLIFIYFLSFFGEKYSGVKFLLILLLIYVMGFIGIFLFFALLSPTIIIRMYNSFTESYNFTIFDITPLTSMLLSFPRIFIAISGEGIRQYTPKTYLFTSYMAQGINSVFYLILLILMETGILREFFNYIKISFCMSEHNFVFSEEQLPNEFLIYNQANNAVLFKEKEENIIGIGNNKIQNNNNNQLFGNMNQVNMNTPMLGNNNQFNSINVKESNYNEINTNSLNAPLLNSGSGNNELVINNTNDSGIINAMNNLSLPETNQSYGVRRGNPFVNKEKDMLQVRNDLTIRIEGLRKTFWFCCRKNVRAVNNLNLGLEANEKFGLLGFNGSGKTTTFKSITNEILYDYGKISLFGFDTRKQFKYIRSKIGYCPQENPLFDFMKVKEILDFYSNLKTCFIPIEVICEKFGLTKYLNTYCVNLSGGNKRKLTFAIAIMNRPSLLLLDEPSTGVDPDSRRFMWKNINELSNSGHKYNMILTTHSMEEAEILCDRVSWLKKGSFVCIGNPEKLKIQYSLGYKLHVKFNNQVINQNKDSLGNNLQEALQTASELIVGFANYSNYLINNPALEPYIRALIKVVSKIKSNTMRITLAQIQKDLSFELIVNTIKERKHVLFSDILNMKNTDNNISEMIISMESLENILTSFR